MAEKQQNLLIDIDALLDTRFGLIYQKFPAEFSTLDVQAFCTRDHNRLWELIDCTEEEWKTAWAGRNAETLESSKPTNLTLEIKRIMVSLYIRGNTSPIHDPLVVTINIYPYVMNEEERSVLIEVFREITWDDLEIKITSLSPERLTPEAIKENYQSLFLYDWTGWISLHVESLKTNKIPTVMFTVPTYIYDNREEYIEAAERSDTNPFTQMQRYLSEYMSIDLVTPELYSLPKPLPS